MTLLGCLLWVFVWWDKELSMLWMSGGNGVEEG